MTGTAAPPPWHSARRGATGLVLGGAVCGLAWAAALRAFMAEFAGPESVVDWFGTFEGILLPGAVAGGLLGWAEHLRRTGRRRGWLTAAPLVFVLATPSVLVSVVTDGGIGGGALAVPLFGMAGGFALSRRGPQWARWAAGAFALLPVPAWLIGASLAGGRLAIDTPRGAWAAVLFLSLLVVLSLGCSIPHRGRRRRPECCRDGWQSGRTGCGRPLRRSGRGGAGSRRPSSGGRVPCRHPAARLGPVGTGHPDMQRIGCPDRRSRTTDP